MKSSKEVTSKDIPTVSILINNYNYAIFLKQAIDSALSQSYPNVEVIVVDDGSTDGSENIILAYGNRITSILKTNGGQASAINAGFLASKGDIVCLLDSDDVFMPDKVETLVRTFREDKNIGWCFHRLKFVEADTHKFVKLSTESRTRKCDYRKDVETGNLKFVPPATSGLCFARWLLDKILPMPEEEGIVISDHYLKTIAIALSEGYFLDEQLAVIKVHQNNRYTENANKQPLKAKIMIATAYQMRTSWPQTKKSADQLFESGLLLAYKCSTLDTNIKYYISEYFSILSFIIKAKIYLKMHLKLILTTINRRT